MHLSSPLPAADTDQSGAIWSTWPRTAYWGQLCGGAGAPGPHHHWTVQGIHLKLPSCLLLSPLPLLTQQLHCGTWLPAVLPAFWPVATYRASVSSAVKWEYKYPFCEGNWVNICRALRMLPGTEWPLYEDEFSFFFLYFIFLSFLASKFMPSPSLLHFPQVPSTLYHIILCISWSLFFPS